VTGPEHYRSAEQLLKLTEEGGEQMTADAQRTGALLAQAHATLALTAATAQLLTDRYVGDGDHINAWTKAGIR